MAIRISKPETHFTVNLGVTATLALLLLLAYLIWLF
jgi:hypothetical protein